MIRPLPDAVIFDMDGLLIDSERLARASTLAVSEQLGHPIPETGCNAHDWARERRARAHVAR
jgi:beta-phosphoglucomutase-like phosphatase (HAD superfamily)